MRRGTSLGGFAPFVIRREMPWATVLPSLTVRGTTRTANRLIHTDREPSLQAMASTLYQILVRASSLLQHGAAIRVLRRTPQQMGGIRPGYPNALPQVTQRRAIRNSAGLEVAKDGMHIQSSVARSATAASIIRGMTIRAAGVHCPILAVGPSLKFPLTACQIERVR
jgi:hypothetical protein